MVPGVEAMTLYGKAGLPYTLGIRSFETHWSKSNKEIKTMRRVLRSWVVVLLVVAVFVTPILFTFSGCGGQQTGARSGAGMSGKEGDQAAPGGAPGFGEAAAKRREQRLREREEQ